MRRNEKVCKKSNKGSRIAKALEGTVTIDEYFELLIKAYRDLHKDENFVLIDDIVPSKLVSKKV